MSHRSAVASLPVFVYGTLMSRSVRKVLLGREIVTQRAVLRGNFQRLKVVGQVFPALCPLEPNTTDTPTPIDGVLLLKLSQDELSLLDDFEDSPLEYSRELLTVHRVEDSASVSAFVYVRGKEATGSVSGVWNFEEFQNKHERPFLNLCQRYIADYRKQQARGVTQVTKDAGIVQRSFHTP